MWEVVTTGAFDDWFAELGEDEQVEVIAKVELLRHFGPRLGRPHADTLKGSKHANMKELRANTGRHVLRVAFAFDFDRKAVLLIGGNKAGIAQRRFYKGLISQADALFDAHQAEIAARREDEEAAHRQAKRKRGERDGKG